MVGKKDNIQGLDAESQYILGDGFDEDDDFYVQFGSWQSISMTSGTFAKWDLRKRSGSMITSIFTISTSAVGAGVLGFPFAFRSAGLVLGILITLLMVIMTMIALHIIAVVSLKTGASNYQECISKYLGRKVGLLSEFVLTLFHVGACVGYLKVIGDVVGPIVNYFLGRYWAFDEKVVVIMFSIVFIFPLCLLKNIKFLGYAGFLAIVATTYTTIFIIFNGVWEFFNNGMSFENPAQLVNPSFQVLYAFPLIGFAFFCGQTIPAVAYELKNPTIRRMDTIIVCGLTLVCSFEVCVGVCGYLTFGKGTEGNILLNFEDMTYIPAIIARLCMAFVVTFAYPIVHFTGRLVMKTLFFRYVPFSDTAYYIVTILWFLGTLILSLYVPGLEIVFAIVGSLGVVILMFVFPSFLLWKLSSEYKSIIWKIGARIYAVLMCTFGIFISTTGVSIALIEAFMGPEWHETFDFWKN